MLTPPTPPLILMKSLSKAQIYDRDLSVWWAENASYYPQFNGKLGEFQKIYSSGAGLDFSGELPYLAIVDGTKVDSASLVFKPLVGTSEPKFGYVADDAKVKELSTAIVAWRDRRRDEAAASAKAAQAAADAAAAAKAAVAAAAAKAAAAANAPDPLCIDQSTGQAFRMCEVRTISSVAILVHVDPGMCVVVRGHSVSIENVKDSKGRNIGNNSIKTFPGDPPVRAALVYAKSGETVGTFTCQ